MTRTGTAKRRIATAAAGIAALAMLAAPIASVATADAAPMAAKTKIAKTVKAKTPKTTKPTTTAAARQAATVASPTDFSSIFATQMPALNNAGWATCSTAITWKLDTSGLTADESTRQIANMQFAFDQWAAASGLTFQFAGTTTMTYNEAAFTLTPAEGTPARQINLAFIADAASDLLGGGTVGMAGPSSVWQNSKEIQGGNGIFRIDAVKKMSDVQVRALFTHELGHVMGLAHAADSGNIMYPVVGDHDELGAGDINGVRTMLKPCAA